MRARRCPESLRNEPLERARLGTVLAVSPKPLNRLPVTPMTYGATDSPAWNSVVPLSDTLRASCWLVVCSASTSAMRPAHPVRKP